MIGGQASNKPVIKSKSDQEERQHNEIFIDVVERIAATVDSKVVCIEFTYYVLTYLLSYSLL